jgi:hypothetical protein
MFSQILKETRAVVQFGLDGTGDPREIPSASLTAGSSLRLKYGSARDDSGNEIADSNRNCTVTSCRLSG